MNYLKHEARLLLARCWARKMRVVRVPSAALRDYLERAYLAERQEEVSEDTTRMRWLPGAWKRGIVVGGRRVLKPGRLPEPEERCAWCAEELEGVAAAIVRSRKATEAV